MGRVGTGGAHWGHQEYGGQQLGVAMGVVQEKHSNDR